MSRRVRPSGDGVSDVAEKLCAYEGEGGLHGAIEHSGIAVTSVEVDDEGIYQDLDTRQEYQALLDWNYQRGQGLSLIHI